MTGWLQWRRLAVGLALVTVFAGLLGGCSSGSTSSETSWGGQVFSNGASRASLPLANASVAITIYSTGESLGSATSDASGGFTLKTRTLPPGTVLLLTATADNSGIVTIKSFVQFPSSGQTVRADPETTLAAVAIERLVAAGTAKSEITSSVGAQALAAVQQAIANNLIDPDLVDFRNSTSVNTAVDTAVGSVALVTSNATAKVLVDGVATNRNAPYVATGLAGGPHTFRVETSTQFAENSVNVPASGAAWVQLNIVSGGGSVPTAATYGGSMSFNVNDETVLSPASGLSVQTLPGFPDKRLVTITLQGVNGVPLQRAINISGSADVVGSDKLAGSAGSLSGSTIRADFLSGTSTVTQFSESVQSSLFTLTFNADGSVSFSLTAAGTLLSGNASGTLPPVGQ